MDQTGTQEWLWEAKHLDPLQAGPATDHRQDDAARTSCHVNGDAARIRKRESSPGRSNQNGNYEEFQLTVATAAHDLRTPLSLACGAAHSLRDASDPDREYWLDCLVRNLTSMQFLVEDFNERLAERNQSERMETFDLAELAGETVRDCAGTIKTHSFHFEGNRAVIRGQREQVRRLLLNLLSNGVKYSACGKAIRVEVWRQKDAVYLHVHDQGRGIPPSESERIFLPYTRLESEEPAEGRGLGLASVRRIAATHGATVLVQGSPGAGSTFAVKFPVAVEDA